MKKLLLGCLIAAPCHLFALTKTTSLQDAPTTVMHPLILQDTTIHPRATTHQKQVAAPKATKRKVEKRKMTCKRAVARKSGKRKATARAAAPRPTKRTTKATSPTISLNP